MMTPRKNYCRCSGTKKAGPLLLATTIFAATEAATGMISFLTRVLEVPRLLGAGMAVDATVLSAGLAVLLLLATPGSPEVAPPPD